MAAGSRESGPKGPPDAEAAALKLLMRRMLSRAELIRRLQKLGCQEAAIAAAVARCQAWGYINDGRLAEALARRATQRRCGTRRLVMWGRTSGIDAAAMQPAIEASRAEEAQRLQGLLERRFPDALADSPLEPRRRAKIFRHLLGKGFAPSLVMRALGGEAPWEAGAAPLDATHLGFDVSDDAP